MEDLNQTKVVQVAVAPNEAIAQMWKEILEDEGIVVALKPGGTGYAFGHSALNEHYVLVRDDQAALAQAILEEVEIADSDERFEKPADLTDQS